MNIKRLLVLSIFLISSIVKTMSNGNNTGKAPSAPQPLVRAAAPHLPRSNYVPTHKQKTGKAPQHSQSMPFIGKR